MSIISNLVHKKLDHDTCTALCFFYDGKFDNELASLGIRLVGPKNFSLYEWPDTIKSPNIHLIDHNDIPKYKYDFIIGNDLGINEQFEGHQKYVAQYSRQLHLPAIMVQHDTYPTTQYHNKKRLKECNATLIKTKTDDKDSVCYGIEPYEEQEKDIDLLIEGSFKPQDIGLLKSIDTNIENFKVIGNNPTLPFNIVPSSYDDYRKTFARTKHVLFLNHQRNIPYSVLWAMANGAVISTLNNQLLREFVGNAGFHGSQIEDVINAIKTDLESPDTEKSMKSRSIVDTAPFNITTFRESWTSILMQYKEKVFTI